MMGGNCQEKYWKLIGYEPLHYGMTTIIPSNKLVRYLGFITKAYRGGFVNIGKEGLRRLSSAKLLAKFEP